MAVHFARRAPRGSGMRARALTSCVSAVLAVLAFPIGARADSDKTCKLDQVSGVLECTLIVRPAPPRTVRLSKELPLVWVRLPWQDAEALSRGFGCVRSVDGITEIGAGYAVGIYNTVTSEQLYLDAVCTWSGEPPPQPPAPPPTRDEFAQDETQALTLQPALSPADEVGGLTGLDSWLWCDDPGPMPADVSLRGWTAEGAVEVVELNWQVDGPSGTVDSSASCGSPEAPSLVWTPETMGDYSVELTAVWAGSWVLSWQGIPLGTFPLGPIALTGPAQPYAVDEYRGELTG